ncbi:MAG: hypothetical protein H6712_33490 [Myxococcales bacterium]|nr:hypothetical protein [Myxococcales bacterium]
MRLLGGAAGLGAVLGCVTPSVFVCTSDGQCQGGRCEVTGYCSFPSSACESGWVYGELAVETLAGTCVGEMSAGTGEEGSSGDPPPATTGMVGSGGPTTVPGTSDVDSGPPDTGPPDTGYADTGYADTGYGGPPPQCLEYSAWVAQCYGEDSGQYALYMCIDIYEDYLGGSYECFYFYEDYLACLSAVDCGALRAGACAEEISEVDLHCFGGA